MPEPTKEFVFEAKTIDIPFATDGLAVPTYYVEDIRGSMTVGAITKLNLVDYRMDAVKEEVVAVHVATLVLPTDKVASWGAFLLRLAGTAAEEVAGSASETDSDAKA